MQIIEGEATLTVGEETVAGKPGTWIRMAVKTPHSIKAQTPVVMLLTLLKAGGPMKHLVAILGSLLLLAVAAFCVCGFMATFEPTDNALAFRIGYTVIGVSCLVGAGVLIANAFRDS